MEGNILINVPLNHQRFRFMADVRVSAVRIHIKLLDGTFLLGTSVVLTHLGTDVRMRNSDGQVLVFNHQKRVTHVKCTHQNEATTSTSLGYGSGFMALSPFTTWFIDLSSLSHSPWIHNSMRFLSVELVFDGEFLPLEKDLFFNE